MKNLVIADLVMSDLHLPENPRKSKSQNPNISQSAIPNGGQK